MFISIGKFSIRKKSKLFRFLRMSKRIEQQAKTSKGIVEVELHNSGISSFYAATLWESMEDMRSFAFSGDHHQAIIQSKELSQEIRLLYYEGDELPDKKEIAQLLETSPNVRVYVN